MCLFYLSFVFKTFVSTPKNKEVFPQNSDLSSPCLIVSLRSVFAPSHFRTFALSCTSETLRRIALSQTFISHSLTLRQETISLLQNRTPQNHIGFTLRSPIFTDLCRILGTSTHLQTGNTSENNVHTWNNVVDSTTCLLCVSLTPELDISRTRIRESWQSPGSQQLPTQILQILEISSVTWQDGTYTVATDVRLQEASLVTKLGQKIEVVALVDRGVSRNVID